MRTVITPDSTNKLYLTELIKHLHDAREAASTSLARQLHDDMGTMLVAAAMELGWMEAHAAPPDASERLDQLGRHLADALVVNRQVIERLRPSLLDTCGLFEASRWLIRDACEKGEIRYEVTLPDTEVQLDPAVLSQAFRAIETVLECTLSEGDLEAVQLDGFMIADILAIRITHRHVGLEPANVLERFRLELASAAHRIASIRGEIAFDAHDQGALYTIHIPLTSPNPR